MRQYRGKCHQGLLLHLPSNLFEVFLCHLAAYLGRMQFAVLAHFNVAQGHSRSGPGHPLLLEASPC